MAINQADESREIGTLLQSERHVLEMIATGAPLAAVLDALCCIIDERSDLISAVFLVDRDGTHLTQAAGPHLPDKWRRATSSLPVKPTFTSCGAAVCRREQVIVSDVVNDPLFETLRDLACSSGIGAVWSTPFSAKDGRVLGTFAVLSPSPGAPSESNLQLVKRATHLACITVARHETEEGLRESEEGLRRSERLLRVVLDALPVGVGVVDGSGNIILSNPAAERIWSTLIRSGPDRYAESKGWWHATEKRLAPEEWPSARAFAHGETTV